MPALADSICNPSAALLARVSIRKTANGLREFDTSPDANNPGSIIGLQYKRGSRYFLMDFKA